ncbi:long-chain fatty acid--CoA ligase [uncultured Pseudokineococcus sp.]|uniref:AMP-dependent synthetase/ligase n=1 Tax=uncultured Pseudokineococcus sp. TaxID=1642928 RepID=UPI002606522D|nr:long-chain fatty acid--CoA ligase [uncultured Pseudokineococcus sp.]
MSAVQHSSRDGSGRGAGRTWWWQVDPPASLADVVVRAAEDEPDREVLARRAGGGWEAVTAARFREEVEQVALGLLDAGVAPGDRVGLMARTRYEWTLVDAAVWAVGGVVVPVYETSAPDQLRWILEDSGAVACFVETPSHARTLAQVADGLPALQTSWVVDGGATGVLPTLADLVSAGSAAGGGGRAELERRRAALTRDDVATIIYTSGTTGRPKGCVLTHGNFLVECGTAVELLPELFEDPGSSTLLFLPLAHVFGRMIEVAVLMARIRVGHSDVARITRDLPTFQPSFVLAVPRVFERVYETARRRATTEGKGAVFQRAADVASAWSRAQDGGRPGLVLRAQHALFDRLVYGKLRAALGGRAEWAVSGGAPLGERLGHFYRGIGLTILEGYGLTETTAATTVNTPRDQRVGSVGRALPGTELRISEAGEVQVRGGHVFREYLGNARATNEVLDDDGWFATGDLGSLDADGYLTITGRSKDILVTSSGKNVSPGPLEDSLRAHPLVSQAVVVGDGRSSVGALVTLDQEALDAWLAQAGRPAAPAADLVEDPDLLAELRRAVDAANESVSSAEGIRRLRVLPVDLTEEGGQLTPSMKVKRGVVLEEFADEVEAMYRPRR